MLNEHTTTMNTISAVRLELAQLTNRYSTNNQGFKGIKGYINFMLINMVHNMNETTANQSMVRQSL